MCIGSSSLPCSALSWSPGSCTREDLRTLFLAAAVLRVHYGSREVLRSSFTRKKHILCRLYAYAPTRTSLSESQVRSSAWVRLLDNTAHARARCSAPGLHSIGFRGTGMTRTLEPDFPFDSLPCPRLRPQHHNNNKAPCGTPRLRRTCYYTWVLWPTTCSP